MRKHLAGLMVGVVVSGAGIALRAQEGIANQKQVDPLDYAQILQLYARYSHAVDLVYDDGTAYSANFTDDGVLKFANNEIKGRAAIKEWARKDNKPRPVRQKGWRAGHTIGNLEAIELGPGVARVIAYFHEGERVSDDIVVKTPQGWRIKRRSPACGTEAERALDPNRPPCAGSTAPDQLKGVPQP